MAHSPEDSPTPPPPYYLQLVNQVNRLNDQLTQALQSFEETKHSIQSRMNQWEKVQGKRPSEEGANPMYERSTNEGPTRHDRDTNLPPIMTPVVEDLEDSPRPPRQASRTMGQGSGRGQGRGHHQDFRDFDYKEPEMPWEEEEYPCEPRRRRDAHQQAFNNLKLQIPHFQGKNDPEVFLEWEKRIEMVFDCMDYPEYMKVKLAICEFSGYALTWWESLQANRRRQRQRPITQWEELKREMHKRFIPPYYQRELCQKLQRLEQGRLSVEDYYKEMELALMRANINEDEEAKIARFMFGLKREIHKVVELKDFYTLEELVHLAIKVERQLETDKTSWKFTGRQLNQKTPTPPPRNPPTPSARPQQIIWLEEFRRSNEILLTQWEEAAKRKQAKEAARNDQAPCSTLSIPTKAEDFNDPHPSEIQTFKSLMKEETKEGIQVEDQPMTLNVYVEPDVPERERERRGEEEWEEEAILY